MTADAPVHDQAKRKSRSDRLLTPQHATVVVAALATFMTLMDAQIVNVALASVTRDFKTSTSSTQWLISAYALSLAASMPASGWFGDRFGTKRVTAGAIATFTVGSALAAVSPSLTLLLAARVVQGLAGGLMIPISLTMMYRAFPLDQRMSAQKTMMMITMVAPATAPLIGGLILTEASWRWIFLINLPIGLIEIMVGVRYLEERRAGVASRLDIPGLVLGAASVALVLYAVSDGPISGWGSPRVLATAAVGVAMVVLFVVRELRDRTPLLDIRLLARDRLFRVCCGLQFLQPMVFGGSLVFTSLYVQESRGLSPLTSGTTTCPEAIGIVCVGSFVAKVYGRVGPRRVTAFGFLLLTIGVTLLSQVGHDTNLWMIRGWTFMLGIGTACIALSIRTAAYAQIGPEQTGHASAIFNTSQRVGQAAGVAILASVLAVAAGRSVHPAASAFNAVFLTAAGIGLLGLLLTSALTDQDAASTMVKVAR